MNLVIRELIIVMLFLLLNYLQRRCKLFVYGGCKGNGNNFLTEIQCLQRCGDDVALALLPEALELSIEIDTCSQKRDAGICPGNVPRFYFDKEEGRCQLFTYGGCGGNSNNFRSQNECVAHCGGPSSEEGEGTGIRPAAGIKPRNSICNLLLSKGTCKATLRRFYFDSHDGTCKLFIFGGCQGNANNFETMEECLSSCIGLDTEDPGQNRNRLSNGRGAGGSSRERGNSNRNSLSAELSTSSSEEELDNVSVCQMPKHFGTCLTVSIRFYHDSEAGACKKFRYSGCGGNGNNFLSGEDCVRTCGGLLEIDKRYDGR